MEALDYKILAKRQSLRDALNLALGQAPVYLSVVKELRYQIALCDAALRQLNFNRRKVRLG